ncbi:MAG: glutamate formiminotransferase [Actinobacteria bacterium]|nr:glutamate formiminotransferase [Actinomycetota bacterium]MBM3697166.1 glutamate formiminotransferase [Actinomycetota bacterium]
MTTDHVYGRRNVSSRSSVRRGGSHRSDSGLLAVPNCSEGRDPHRIARLVAAADRSAATVLDVHSDPDHHRTVITLGGPTRALVDAGVALAIEARDLIDLRAHDGVHPFVGALDVLPFVALRPSAVPDAVAAARTAAGRIGAEAEVPCVLYGIAAGEGRERPARLRAGGLPALAARMQSGEVIADAGPALPHPGAGVVLVGAREPLVAWNIWLPGATVDDARAVAAAVREGGGGGGLPSVRALGLMCTRTGLAQVSLNVEDYRRTPLMAVVGRVRREAAARGLVAGESELVGMVPRAALGGKCPRDLGLPGLPPAKIIDTTED